MRVEPWDTSEGPRAGVEESPSLPGSLSLLCGTVATLTCTLNSIQYFRNLWNWKVVKGRPQHGFQRIL